MSRHICKPVAVLMTILVVATGCHPTQPFFLHEDGDLSHLLETATEVEYPDAEAAGLADARQPLQPHTIENTEFHEFWDLTLEECVAIALHNTRFVRTLNDVGPNGTNLLRLAENEVGRQIANVYNPAIVETDPNFGVPQALSAFDAQLATNLFWETSDRPLNRAPQGGQRLISERNAATYQMELSKRAATGTQIFFRNRIIHEDANNSSTIFDRPVRTTWETNLEAEVRQPLLRGRGTQVNRVPVIIGRVETDIAITGFEANVRNLVFDVERAYWGLYCAYRELETAKVGRDSALATWKKLANTTTPRQDEANARGRYFLFRSLMESALGGTGTDQTVLNRGTDQRGLLQAEQNLRHLMGIAATDGRLIRPNDEPTLAKVEFDWNEVLHEALVRDPNLRQQKWRIKRREMECLQARNNLLPQLDAVALYRWLGIGDHLVHGDPGGANFPNPRGGNEFGGSSAIEEMFEGNFQEGRIGVQLTMPVGFRREMANVRNAQLQLARDHAALEEMELDVSHLLSTAIRGLDVKWQLVQTNFNRWKAAFDEVQSLETQVEIGTQPVNLLLDALQRRADAQISFYAAVCDYNIAIANVHFRKGSLLEYDNVLLAEGPWPKKAYWDALERARERDASYYLDYGWTRPKVISRGAVEQHGFLPTLELDAADSSSLEGVGEPIATPEPTPAQPNAIEGTPDEQELPLPSQGMMRPLSEAIPHPPGSMDTLEGPRQAAGIGRSVMQGATAGGTAAGEQAAGGTQFAWGQLGLPSQRDDSAPVGTAVRKSASGSPASGNPLRTASHEEPLR